MPSEPGLLNFPTTLDDIISLIEANNHASATLTAAITNSQLTIPVSQIAEFSASGYATILDALVNPTVIEIVKYTSKVANDLIVPAGGRGQQGTAAAAFSSAAPIEQRPTARHHTVLAAALIEIEKKLGYGTPIHPQDVAGTNVAGNHQEIVGGKGTGLGIPGQLAARYPLIGATGAVLQSLSSDRFPLSTNLFTNTTFGTAVANTTTETSLFTGMTGSSGSTRIIEAGLSAPGTVYRVRLTLEFSTTGTPTGRLRIKLNGVTDILDTGVFNMPTGAAAGLAQFEFLILVTSVGASGSWSNRGRFEAVAGTGLQTPTIVYATSFPTINTTIGLTIDATWAWGTASASNSINMTQAIIERVR